MSTGIINQYVTKKNEPLTTIYATNCSVRRVGEVKCFYIETTGADTAITPSQWTTLLTLPEEYRPTVTFRTKGSGNNGTTFYPFLLQIGTDGVVTIYNYSDSGTMYISSTFTFI